MSNGCSQKFPDHIICNFKKRITAHLESCVQFVAVLFQTFSLQRLFEKVKNILMIQKKLKLYWVVPYFKKDIRPILNNYNIVERRYKSRRRQLAKNKDLEQQYKSKINKLINNGYIEFVNETLLEACDPKRHINYLSKLVVERQDKISIKVDQCLMQALKTSECCSK